MSSSSTASTSRRLRRAVALLCTSVAACGGGGDESAAPSTTFSVGSEELFEIPATTTTSVAMPGTMPSVAAAPSTVVTRVVNQSVRDDSSGWRLTLTVAEKLEFRSDEDIRFELVFENRSSGKLYVDSRQDLRFAIAVQGASEASWTTRSCYRPSSNPPAGGAVAYEPEGKGQYIDAYPVEQTSRVEGFDADQCRVPPGDYIVVGQLDWCPPESLEEVRYQEKVDYICRDDGVVTVVSAPLAIQIR